MNIELGKTYLDASNNKVRIICVDRKDAGFPVLGLVHNGSREYVGEYTSKGDGITNIPLLEEYNPWKDVSINTPICVLISQKWLPRHFAHMSADGKTVCFFIHGTTSHTSEGKISSCDLSDAFVTRLSDW